MRNEQSAVHLASGFAKTSNRLRTFACTSSIGPGATNMITGAALATINRLPVLLLPGDIFARRNVAPVLQQLESPKLPGHQRQRLLQAGIALLGPHLPSGTNYYRASRSYARADFSRGIRRSHLVAATGCAGRRLRFSGGTVSQRRMDHSTSAARQLSLGRAIEAIRPQSQAADYCRRRGAVFSEARERWRTLRPKPASRSRKRRLVKVRWPMITRNA